ncbi:carboxypeptidase regulatory-like domain-containing protein [Sulfurifustis variabilis]|uniref:carboxypeptidase regulatory-like domain-containing protein n=1 Tax=Sulfurifustis variabilis TaxID=1675686 RepID=UPI0014746E4C|nr:carboxypeptidase regulatory-like domain-containing protein [Sulfurifustis variabilis]
MRRLGVAALAAWLVVPSPALAGVPEAIGWLATQQNADGSFGGTPGSLATPVQSTAEVLRAYQTVGQQSQPPYAPALAYLNGDTEENTEFLARKIVLNAAAGGDVSALVTALLAHQNADGGFGDRAGHDSTVFDTGYALEALAAANYTSGTFVGYAVGYLLNRQSAAGGWADGGNAASVFTTAQAMRALWPYRNAFLGVSASLTAAQNFLLAQRGTDGAWSEPFETALALRAIVPNATDLALVETSVAGLEAAQLANGSWVDDAYTTALALQAIQAYQARKGGAGPTLTGAISGYVVRAGSTEPIAAAQVALAERLGVSVLTNGDGYFLIPNVPAGDYTVTAGKSGYTTASRAVTAAAGQVTLAGALVLDLATQSGLAAGRIFDAQDLTALAGAAVTLTGGATYTAVSGTDGSFSFGPLAPGDYGVSIARSGYDTVTGSATIVGGQTLTINQGLVRAGGFQDAEPATITGAVASATTGLPIAGAVFDLGGGLTATSGADGQFAIASVPRGNYTATLSAGGFVAQTYIVSFPAGSLGNLGTLSLYPASAASAPTTLALNGTVVDGVSGAPIAGATVTLTDTGATATSGIDGRFLLDGITLTSFSLTASATGYQTRTAMIQVSAFGEAQVSLALSPPGSGATATNLQGVVRDATSSAPVAGARVSIEGTTLTTVSDATGNYTLSGIEPLSFTVSVAAVGYAQAQGNITLASHGNYTLDPLLHPLAATSFQVLSVSANPASAGANETLLFTAEIASLLSAPKAALVTGEVLDATGTSVANLTPYAEGTTTPASEFSFAAGETKTLTLPWPTAQLAPSTYTVLVRVVEPGTIYASRPRGEILAEGGGYGAIVGSSRIAGAMAIDPPLAQAGTTTPVSFTALVQNGGNLPLAEGSYELTVTQPDTGTLVHSAVTTAGGIEVGQHATVAFGGWVPTATGDLDVRVRSLAAGVAGEIAGSLYVGDRASGSFTVDRNIVREGTSTVRGRVAMQGVDVRTGTSTDPLFALVKEAVRRGGLYTAPGGTNWHRTNRCLGCHIQTQSVYGLASSLDKADVDRQAALFLYNAIAGSQQSDGGLRISHPQHTKTQTTLGLWSLSAWPDKLGSFRAKYHAARHLHDRRLNSGSVTFWRNDHASAGWWVSDVSHTALTVTGMADLVRSADTIDLSQVRQDTLSESLTLGGGTEPRDLALGADGALYVLKANGQINRIDFASGQTTTVVTGLPNPSFGLAIAPDQSFLVSTETATGQIIRVAPDGSRSTIYSQSGVLRDIEFGADGFLYVADYPRNRILRLTSAGQVVSTITSGLFNRPSGLLARADGSVLVANRDAFNILRIASDGTVSIHTDGFSFPPLWLADAPDGNMYVSTADYSNSGQSTPVGLSRVDQSGIVERVAVGALYRPLLTIDQTVWVANGTTNRLNQIVPGVQPTDLLPAFRTDIDRAARYFLGNHRDNSGDNAVQAMRLAGMAEARSVTADATLRADLDTAIAFAANLLRSRQRADGGWGRSINQASDPLITAMVGIAIDYTDPSPDDPAVRRTIQYLLNTQAGDGSWNNANNGLTTRLASTSFVMAYLPKALERLGGIDVDLHVKLPANVQLANPSIAPTTVIPGVDVEYIWTLLGVTSAGRNVEFDLTLLDMQLNETRPVATAAYLEFDNSFTAEKLQIALEVPTVRAAADMALAVSTDRQNYQPNESVSIGAVVSNTGPTIASGDVRLSIRAPGSEVDLALLPSIPVSDLAAGAQVAYPGEWNTGSTLAGAYEVYGRLYDTQGRFLSESRAPFNIGAPAVTVATGVATDKPSYDAWDTVQIEGRVQNVAPNAVLAPSRVEITVRSPAGQVLYFDTRDLGELMPGALRDLPFPMTLADAQSGTYPVELKLKDLFTRTLLSTSTTSFQVVRRELQAISGTVSVQTPSVYLGDANACTETAKNVSATDLANVKLIHQLIDMGSGALVDEATETVNLPAGGLVYSYFRNIDSNALGLGGYSCVIKAELNGEERTLAFGGFQVVPPPIRIDAALALGPRGRLLVLLDNGGSGPNAEPCSSVTSLSLATSFVGLSPAAALEARLYDGTGVLVDTETAALASFAGEVDTAPGGTGANLVFAELTAQSAVLRVDPLAPGTPLGAGYRLDLVVTDGSPLIVSSGLIHTDCSQTMQVGDLYGAFAVTALTAVPATDNAYRDDDPHGPQDSPGLLAQRRFLERLLTAAGWSYTITDTAEAFTRELRTGGYRTYALFDEQEKLPVDVQKELREAAFRGEGLLLAGNHDARHHKLLDAAGVKLIGNVSHAVTAEHEPSPLALAGGIGLYPLDKALRIKRLTADRFASYLTSGPSHDKNDPNDCRDQAPLYDNGIPAARPVDECEGAPDAYLDAATLNGYGRGRAAFVGVDLLALATRDGDASLAAATILKALAWVSPGEPAYTVGAVVPIRITLTNQGIATVASVTLQAANLAFVDLREGSLVDDATVVIDVALAVGETKTLDLWVRLANLPGPASLTATVTAPTVGLVASAVYPLEAVQPETLGSIKARLDALIGANHPDRHALELAAADLERALQNFDPARAIADVLKATDALLGLADPAIVDIRAALGTWVGWAGAYVY